MKAPTVKSIHIHVNVEDIINKCKKNSHGIYSGGCHKYVYYTAPKGIVEGSTITLTKNGKYTFVVAAVADKYIPEKLGKFSDSDLTITRSKSSSSIIDVVANTINHTGKNITMSASFRSNTKAPEIINIIWDPTIKVNGGTHH